MTLADGEKFGGKRWEDEDVDLTASGTVGEDLVVELKLSPDECQKDLQFILLRGDVPMPSDRYQIQTRGNIVQLTLKQSQKEDTGHYALVAKKLSTGLSIPSDERIDSRRKIRLSIKDPSQGIDEGEPPIFVRRLSDLAVKVGTRTRFLVEIRSSTSPKVTWHKNDEPVQSGSRFSFVHEGNFYCVDVAPVMVDDQGNWTCMAENSGGRSSCTSFLNVIVPKAYKKPEFVEELRALLTETGTVSLECKVVGVPTPVLKWFKDQKEIKAGDVFALTANPDDPTSLGTYTCEAVNCMGTACSSSRVHVVGKGSREGSLKPADALTPSGPLPVFKQILRDESCKIGDTLTLSCQVLVPPWPKTITWYNKEGRVEPSEKYHIIEDGLGGYSIEIKGVEAMDEGEWKCVATSAENMKQFSTCYVAMSLPKNYRMPRFMESLKAVLTEEGLVSFECKVVGFPTPLLRWFKDGQELHPGDVYQLTGTNSLGSYCCIARNCMGEAKSTAELTVEDIQNQLNEEERMQLLSTNQAPKFVKGLRSCEARINEDFTFTIQVSVSPEPSLSWYRDDVPIIESEKYRLAREVLGTCHLEVKKLEFMDQAEWKCVAANDFGHSVTSCFLKLVIPKHFKKPKFLESLRAILSEEGAVNLECKVIGVPQPVLKWYKDGVELKPGDIHRIISGQDGTCCLGTYTCEATNCMGSVSSSASLLGFEDRVSVRKEEAKETPALHELARNLSLSTIHEERTSQLYDTPQTDHSITLDDRGEVSFSFDGKEVSVSLYETPDLTEEEALQIVEMYADQLSEHITEGNVIELPPMRFTKETSTTGNLLMEAVVIDVSPDYFIPDEGDDLRTEADVEDVSIMDDQMQSLRSLSCVSSPTAEIPSVPSGSPPSRPPRRKESRESASSRSERSEKSLPKGYDWSESYHSAKEPSVQVQSSIQDDSGEAFTDALSSSGAGKSKAEESHKLYASFVEQTVERVPLDEKNMKETIATKISEAFVEEVPVKRKKKKKTGKGSRTPSLSSKASSEESYSLEGDEKSKKRGSKSGRRGSASSKRSSSESIKFESAASMDRRRRESDATLMIDDIQIEQTEENLAMDLQNKVERMFAREPETMEESPASAISTTSTLDSMSKTNKERLLENVYKLSEPIMVLRSALVDLDSLLSPSQGDVNDGASARLEITERIVAPVENLCELVSGIETKALKSAGDRSLAQNVRISLLEAIGGPTEELLRGIELIRNQTIQQQQDPQSSLIILESLTDPVDEILIGLTKIEHELSTHETIESSLMRLEKPIAMERMCRAVERLGTNVGQITERRIFFGDESASCSVIERLQSAYQSLEAFLSTVPLNEASGTLENNVDTLVVETLVRPLEELSRSLNVFSTANVQTQSEQDIIVSALEKSLIEMSTRLEALTAALEIYEKESGEQGITELHADLVTFLRYTMDDAVERLEKSKLKKKRVTQETRIPDNVTPMIFDGKSRLDGDEIESAVESSEIEESNVLQIPTDVPTLITKKVTVPSKSETKTSEIKSSKLECDEKSSTDVEAEQSSSTKIPKKKETLKIKKQNRKPPELDADLPLPEMLLDPLIDVQANLSDVISDFESQESAEESSLPGGSELAACLTELRECVATAAHTATTLKSANTVNALVDLREPLLDLQLAMASAASPEEVKLIQEATVPLAELKVIVAAAMQSPQTSEASQIQMKPVLRMLEDIEAEVTKVSEREETTASISTIPVSPEILETRSVPQRPPEEVERAAVALTGVHFALSTALERVNVLAVEKADSLSLPSNLQLPVSSHYTAEQSATSNLIASIEDLRQCVGTLAVAIGTPVVPTEANNQYSYDILFDELAKLEEPLLNLQKVLLTEQHGPEDRHVLNDVASPIRSLKEVVQDVTREVGGGSTPIVLELIEDVEKDVALIAMEALKKALASKNDGSDDDGRASVSSSSKPGEVPAIISKWLDPIEDWLTSTAESEESRGKSVVAPVVDDLKRELLKIAIQTSYSEPPSDVALIEALTELQEPLIKVCRVITECHEPENLDIVEGLVQPTKHLLGTIFDASLTYEAGKVLRPVLEAVEELENQIPLTIKRATYERELQRVVRSMTPEEMNLVVAEEIAGTSAEAQNATSLEVSKSLNIASSMEVTLEENALNLSQEDSESLRERAGRFVTDKLAEESAKASVVSIKQEDSKKQGEIMALEENTEVLTRESVELLQVQAERSVTETSEEKTERSPVETQFTSESLEGKNKENVQSLIQDHAINDEKSVKEKAGVQADQEKPSLEKIHFHSQDAKSLDSTTETSKPEAAKLADALIRSETVEIITVDGRQLSKTTALESKQSASSASAIDSTRADQLDLWTLTLLDPLDRLGNAVLTLDRSVDEEAHGLLCRPLDSLHKQIEIAESQFNPAGPSLENDVETIIEGFLSPVNQLHSALGSAIEVWQRSEQPRAVVCDLLRVIAESSTELCEHLDALRKKLVVQRNNQSLQEQQEDASLVETINAVLAPLEDVRNLIEDTLKSKTFLDNVKMEEKDDSVDHKRHQKVEAVAEHHAIVEESVQEREDAVFKLQEVEVAKTSFVTTESLATAVRSEETGEEVVESLDHEAKIAKFESAEEVIEKNREETVIERTEVSKISRRSSKGKEESLDIEESTARPLEELIEAIVDSSAPRRASSSPEGYQSITPDVLEDLETEKSKEQTAIIESTDAICTSSAEELNKDETKTAEGRLANEKINEQFADYAKIETTAVQIVAENKETEGQGISQAESQTRTLKQAETSQDDIDEGSLGEVSTDDLQENKAMLLTQEALAKAEAKKQKSLILEAPKDSQEEVLSEDLHEIETERLNERKAELRDSESLAVAGVSGTPEIRSKPKDAVVSEEPSRDDSLQEISAIALETQKGDLRDSQSLAEVKITDAPEMRIKARDVEISESSDQESLKEISTEQLEGAKGELREDSVLAQATITDTPETRIKAREAEISEASNAESLQAIASQAFEGKVEVRETDNLATAKITDAPEMRIKARDAEISEASGDESLQEISTIALETQKGELRDSESLAEVKVTDAPEMRIKARDAEISESSDQESLKEILTEQLEGAKGELREDSVLAQAKITDAPETRIKAREAEISEASETESLQEIATQALKGKVEVRETDNLATAKITDAPEMRIKARDAEISETSVEESLQEISAQELEKQKVELRETEGLSKIKITDAPETRVKPMEVEASKTTVEESLEEICIKELEKQTAELREDEGLVKVKVMDVPQTRINARDAEISEASDHESLQEISTEELETLKVELLESENLVKVSVTDPPETRIIAREAEISEASVAESLQEISIDEMEKQKGEIRDGENLSKAKVTDAPEIRIKTQGAETSDISDQESLQEILPETLEEQKARLHENESLSEIKVTAAPDTFKVGDAQISETSEATEIAQEIPKQELREASISVEDSRHTAQIATIKAAEIAKLESEEIVAADESAIVLVVETPTERTFKTQKKGTTGGKAEDLIETIVLKPVEDIVAMEDQQIVEIVESPTQRVIKVKVAVEGNDGAIDEVIEEITVQKSVAGWAKSLVEEEQQAASIAIANVQEDPPGLKLEEKEEDERLQKEEEETLKHEEAERLQRESEERLKREEAERLQREEEERLERDKAERLQREQEELLKREEAERLQREEEERLNREEAERLQKEEDERLKREEAERLQREEEERLKRETADRLQREEKERLKREEASRLQKEEEERLKREEAERLQREEAERLKREEAERLQREEEEKLKRAEAERLQREEDERLKREEAERLQREEEDRLKREEAERLQKEEEERLKREEAARLQKEEDERLKREEAARLQKEEGERLKREEAARLQKEEDERLKHEEAARLQKEEDERLKREEAARLQKEEDEILKREKAERLQSEEEERLKREEAERLQREEQERLKREEAERLQKEEDERLKREEAERLHREEQERIRKEEEAEKLRKEEAEKIVREEHERQKQAEQEAERLKKEKEETERLEREELHRKEQEAARLKKEEEDRLKKEEADRLQKAALEKQKQEAERLKQEELERAKKEEEERLKKEETERLEKEKLEKQKEESDRAKQAELDRTNKENEETLKKKQAESLEKEKIELQKQEELERTKKEENERLKKDEAERLEKDKLEREKQEQTELTKKTEKDRQQKEEAENLKQVESVKKDAEAATGSGKKGERKSKEDEELPKKKERRRSSQKDLKQEESVKKDAEAATGSDKKEDGKVNKEDELPKKTERRRSSQKDLKQERSVKKDTEAVTGSDKKQEGKAKEEDEGPKKKERRRSSQKDLKQEESAKKDVEPANKSDNKTEVKVKEEEEQLKKKERRRSSKKELERSKNGEEPQKTDEDHAKKEEVQSMEITKLQREKEEAQRLKIEELERQQKGVAEKLKEEEQEHRRREEVERIEKEEMQLSQEAELAKKELKMKQTEEIKKPKRRESKEEARRSSKTLDKAEKSSEDAELPQVSATSSAKREENDTEKTPVNSEEEIRDKIIQRHVRVQDEIATSREPRSSSTIRTDSEMESEHSETFKSQIPRDSAISARRRSSGRRESIEDKYEISKERSEHLDRRGTDRLAIGRTREATLSSAEEKHYVSHYSATSRYQDFTPGPRDRGKKPSFCTKLTDRTAAEASRIKLTCTVLGDPEPRVYWTKDGRELPHSTNRHCTTEENGMVSLELYAASPKDSGEYSCVAINVHGQAYTEAKLKVYAGYEPAPAVPTFTRSIKDTYHAIENELVLECRVRGQPSPKITWLKDGQVLQIGDRYQQCDLGDGICRLKISKPDFYDGGLYTCRAENDSKMSDRTSHVVNFEGKGREQSAGWRGSHRNLTSSDRDTGRPRFSSYLTDHSVPAGGTIALQVEVKGVPPPDITWMRGDKREPIPAYRARTFADSGVYTLIVPEATESETGTYVCRASNAYGYVDTTANVEVVSSGSTEGGKPAMFISRPAETMIHVTVGEDVSVSFRVNGVPKPRIVWMKGLRDITNGPRSYKESHDDYCRLTLKRAQVSDEGTYCILAKNRYGCDRTFYTVKVKQRARSLTPSQDWGTLDTDNLLADIHDTERSYLKQVPGPITTEPVVVDGGRNWLALTWGKAVQHGPAPVVAYRVDAWLLGGEGGARWVELGITPVNAFDAFNLRPGGEYKFRITPRNRYGWGDSVTMTNSVTVREVVKFPEFSKTLPGQLKALRGETLHLECEVRSESKAEVKWYRDTTDIDGIKDPRYMTYYNGSKSTLTVQAIKEHDSGRYVCEATNPAGRVSTFARVQVVTDPKIVEADEKLRRMRTLDANNEETPPEFTMRLRDRRVQMTYPVRLTCQVSGHPEPEITWYKNREEIFQDENVSFWDDESHFHTLEISHSTLEDSGIYMAKARNVNGSLSCRCHLVVDKGIRAYVAPEFFRHLDTVYTVKAGGELRMTAQIEAYPTVGIVWHRDGHRLRPSRSAVMTLNHDGSVELSLAYVTSRDAGLYCCTATNEVGRTESTTRVTVLGAADDEPPSITHSLPDVVESLDVPYSKEPLFVTKPLSTEAVEGDTVIILCEVVGDPKPEVIWLRDFLRPDYYRDAAHFRRVGAGPQYRLEIPYAKLDFTGAYTVIAKNCHGEAKAIISLQIYARGQGKADSSMEQTTIKHGNVQTLPSIKRPLRDLRCCDGDAVTLICKVHATPEPDVRWEKSGKLVPLGEDFAADFDGETARLSIQHVYPEDEGEYTCVAYNDLGKAFTSACLIVDVPEGKESALSRRLIRPVGLLSAESTPISTPRSTPVRSLSPSCVASRRELKPAMRTPRGQTIGRRPRLPIGPKFYAVPHNRVAEEGETVRFQCAVAGHPSPWVTWDKDGIPVTPTARITLKEKDDVRILEITEITHEDAGLYRITLENDVGRTEATARLEIIKGRHSSLTRSIRTRSASPRTYSIYSRSPITSAIRGDTHLRPNINDSMGGRGGTLSPTLPRWHYRNGKPPIESPEPARRLNKRQIIPIKSPHKNGVIPTTKPKNPNTSSKPRSSSVPRHNQSPREIPVYHTNARQTKTSPGPRRTNQENILSNKNTTSTNGSMIPKRLCSRSPKLGNEITVEKHREFINVETPRESIDVVEFGKTTAVSVASELSEETVKTGEKDEMLEPEILRRLDDESIKTKISRVVELSLPAMSHENSVESSRVIVESHKKEPRPPVIHAAPADVIALRGAKVILLATFEGEPQPRVRWLRKGRDVRNDDRAEIETSRGLTCLTLEGVTTEQADKYAVTLENEAGRDCRYVNVTVEGVPDPPAGTPCVQSITRAGKAIVTWRSPPYDGGCAVTGYSVEMKRGEEPCWIAVAEARHSLSHTVTGLVPEETYRFRIRAENAHGVSEPSTVSDIVIVPGENDEEIGGQVFVAEINQIEIEEEEEEFEPAFEARIVSPEDGRLFEERYNVLEELGKGRYGIVRRIVEKSSNMNLAAKFVRTIKATDRQQVHEEIGIMNMLRHPKLLRLAAAFESPKEMIMVTEYISGGELFERVVADDFTLTEKDSIQFVKQICEGVEYMHAHSVVHLDLKPENIMCHTRTSHRIKLIDFGLAQTLKPDTPVRVLFGTPEFIPPEIIGFEPIGTESDMWSVGVICYVLLTGLSPFMGDNDAETFANITRADYDFDDKAFTAISHEAKDFISALLIKRKELRMSAKQCLEHDWLAQRAESMSRVALPTDKLKKFIVRRKWQKTGNAIRALGRMAILSANSRRSLSAGSSPTKREFGEELFNDVTQNVHGFKPIRPVVVVEDRTGSEYQKKHPEETMEEAIIKRKEEEEIVNINKKREENISNKNEDEKTVNADKICEEIVIEDLDEEIVNANEEGEEEVMVIASEESEEEISIENEERGEEEIVIAKEEVQPEILTSEVETITINSINCPEGLRVDEIVTEVEIPENFDEDEIVEVSPVIEEIEESILPKNEGETPIAEPEYVIEEVSNLSLSESDISIECDTKISSSSSCFDETTRKQSFSSFASLEITELGTIEIRNGSEKINKNENTVEDENRKEEDVGKISDSVNISQDGNNEERERTARTPFVTKAWCKTNNPNLVDEEDEVSRLAGRGHSRHIVRTGSVSRTAKMFEKEEESNSSSARQQNPLNRTTPKVPEGRPQNERIRKAFAFWNK